ncbi:hypothetical protein GCM10027294_53430 [Marinactinospora endophytica]
MHPYPTMWALLHAPVRDAVERAILVAIAATGDEAGTGCQARIPSLTTTARVTETTVEHVLQELVERGLLRQDGPVWEVLVPADYYSTTQICEINERRAENGLAPITAVSHPTVQTGGAE